MMEWRNGATPTGGEVWHIMRLAWSVPGGIKTMLPEAAEGGSNRHHSSGTGHVS